MKQMKKEDAVSPVVGVMLMLVVTIVIAAVVAAFAGGLAEDTAKVPIASFKADVTAADTIVFTHMSGDAISPSNIKAVVKQGNSVLKAGNPTPSAYDEYGSPLPLTPGDTLTLDGMYLEKKLTTWELIDTISGQAIASGSLMANY